MYNNLISKLFFFQRRLKLLIIFFIDISIIFFSSYSSLAIRFDQWNLLNIINERYLVNFEFFFIPIISYFFIVLIFKLYNYSFRYYNLLLFQNFLILVNFLAIANLINFLFGQFYELRTSRIYLELMFLIIVCS